MCHGKAVAAFPTPTEPATFDEGVQGYHWANAGAQHKIAILPDIYGCNPFYRGLATRYAQLGADVYLVDTFAGFGDLPEMTRDAAFARRGKVADKEFLDRFEAFVTSHSITGVIGFCLGGLYVFELARRGVQTALVGLYGFPQGLPNQDPLPTPFEYLHAVDTPFAMLLGADDPAVGADNVKRLQAMAPDVPGMDLTVYDGVGHDFLPLLDSEDPALRATAEDAIATCDRLLLAA